MKKITLIMKFTQILIVSIIICFSISGQVAGDYRSIANGNWNDPTKWETYDGINWITAASYPGQNSGTRVVSIISGTEIELRAAVPNPIASLIVTDTLILSSENPVSLTVLGDVVIYGQLRIEDQNGAKAHTLFIGRNLTVGEKIYDGTSCPPVAFIPAIFQTASGDDKLNVVLNSTGTIDSGPDGLEFQDITFNGTGFGVTTPIYIRGTASFVNGIVTVSNLGYSNGGGAQNADCNYAYANNGSLIFYDDAMAVGASNASFVDGTATKLGNDSFTFPIGNGSVYAPLTISPPPDQMVSVSASYVRSNASDLEQISDPGLFNVSNCEYWILDGASSNYPLDITASWSNASGCTSSSYVTNASEVTLAHSSQGGTSWDSHSGSGVGTSANGSVTWKGATVSGFFTLGNLSSVCNAPWGSATNISSNSATLKWTGVGNAVSYDVDYKPYTSSAWINAARATTSLTADISGLSPWTTYDWRIRTNCSLSSSSYRQAQFQTLCGPPSGLTTTNVTGNSATLSWSAFANYVSYNVEYKPSSSSTWTIAGTGLTSTSYTLGGLTAGTTYNWRVLVNCTTTTQGGYAQSSFTTVACNDIYEPNNLSTQAIPLAPGTTIFANISSSTDIDWFKLTVPTNSTINVFLSNLPADYDLYVYDKNLILAGSSTTTGNESLTFNVRGKNPTYYIKVVGKNGVFNASQCYNLVAYVSSATARQMSRVSDLADETNVPNGQALYPNPASEFVYLHFNSVKAGATEVQILNTLGQMVKQYPVNIIRGYNQIKIPISEVKPGMYLLKINKGELNMTTKFVIAR